MEETATAFTGAIDELEAAAAGRFDLAPVRRGHRLNSVLYTKEGRFDQDSAASVPILPLLARVRELATLAPESDAYGFLERELLRGRNALESALKESARAIDRYLAAGREVSNSSARR